MEFGKQVQTFLSWNVDKERLHLPYDSQQISIQFCNNRFLSENGLELVNYDVFSCLQRLMLMSKKVSLLILHLPFVRH